MSASFLSRRLLSRLPSLTFGDGARTFSSSPAPCRPTSSWKIPQPVLNHYEKSHIPLATAPFRRLGEPYTDTKALEKWTDDVLSLHHPEDSFKDRFAWAAVRFARIFTHLFFRKRYHHHAVVLETVAAVPGMVAGFHRHFRSLRTMKRDNGWIGHLLEEAENERMHLLTWMTYCQPTLFERMLVVAAQVFYTGVYATLYTFTPSTAHRFVGYLEEEATASYTLFLQGIDSGALANGPAPTIARNYWNLAPDATIRDVVLCVRADETMHRDANHRFADLVSSPQEQLIESPKQ
eukprot:TRINITY_DN1239_c0_g1_i3.p1 TRINITY_DN1239_c0_g1~~TRINITY_DN1239_c0_g1_i3.p1  ORF type:complete len:292 (-),score=52.57 TRINITY_DN1239_c0_g1_i3:182-1057(-)